MENERGVRIGVQMKDSHLSTILIVVAASLVNIPRFLNEVSLQTLYHEVGDLKDVDEWNQLRRVSQRTYVATGVVAYALFAFLFERCRRRMCLYLVCLLQLTISVLLLAANAKWLLHVTRAVSAFSDVGAEMFCVIYVSEIAPDELRGGLIATPKLFYIAADLLPISMFALNVKSASLPYSFAGIALSVLVAICNYVFLPESPIYLLRKEDLAGATHALQILRRNEENSFWFIESRQKILKATRSDSRSTTSIFQECISPRAIKFCSIALALYLSRFFIGFWDLQIKALLRYWYILRGIEIIEWYILLIQAVIAILGILLAVLLCDRVGRKMLLLISSWVCIVLIFADGISGYIYTHVDETIFERMDRLFVVLSIIFILNFNIGAHMLPEVLIADIFPPKILNIQMAILGAFVLCVEYITLYGICDGLGNLVVKYYVLLWIFGGLGCIVLAILTKFLPETKRKSPGFLFMDAEGDVLFSSLRDEQ